MVREVLDFYLSFIAVVGLCCSETRSNFTLLGTAFVPSYCFSVRIATRPKQIRPLRSP